MRRDIDSSDCNPNALPLSYPSIRTKHATKYHCQFFLISNSRSIYMNINDSGKLLAHLLTRQYAVWIISKPL